MKPTDDQKRRANEAVAATLGIYAVTASPDDPAAAFGYECAVNAIMLADARIGKLTEVQRRHEAMEVSLRQFSVRMALAAKAAQRAAQAGGSIHETLQRIAVRKAFPPNA